MNRVEAPRVLRSLQEKIRTEWTALLLIDLLNDFLDPQGKTASRAGRPIEFARAAISAQQTLLAAARNAGVLVVHLAQETLPDQSSASGPWLDARSRATYSVEDLCVAGTWGAEVIKELEPVPGEPIVRKHRYSGFAGTHLDSLLRSRGIQTVVCAGVSTNVCVEATAREAFSHEYYVVYASDACASWDQHLHEATLATAAHRYATVVPTADIVAEWQPTQGRA